MGESGQPQLLGLHGRGGFWAAQGGVPHKQVQARCRRAATPGASAPSRSPTLGSVRFLSEAQQACKAGGGTALIPLGRFLEEGAFSLLGPSQGWSSQLQPVPGLTAGLLTGK